MATPVLSLGLSLVSSSVSPQAESEPCVLTRLSRLGPVVPEGRRLCLPWSRCTPAPAAARGAEWEQSKHGAQAPLPSSELAGPASLLACPAWGGTQHLSPHLGLSAVALPALVTPSPAVCPQGAPSVVSSKGTSRHAPFSLDNMLRTHLSPRDLAQLWVPFWLPSSLLSPQPLSFLGENCCFYLPLQPWAVSPLSPLPPQSPEWLAPVLGFGLRCWPPWLHVTLLVSVRPLPCLLQVKVL